MVGFFHPSRCWQARHSWVPDPGKLGGVYRLQLPYNVHKAVLRVKQLVPFHPLVLLLVYLDKPFCDYKFIRINLFCQDCGFAETLVIFYKDGSHKLFNPTKNGAR